MTDVFLSYSSANRSQAESLANELSGHGFDVFWDRHILTGENFVDRIESELEEARCTVVLWSRDSIKSRWVHAEAHRSASMNKLLEVRLEEVSPPLPFGTGQVCELGVPGRRDLELRKLFSILDAKTKRKDAVGTLPVPEAGEECSASHISLIHTCRRCTPDFDEKYGMEMYQFHVITYSSPLVLDQIEWVTYYLDRTYSQSPAGTRRKLDSTYRSSCFGISDLAWGYSVVEADVKIRDQVKLVHLSRFINLHDGPPLKGEYFEDLGTESWWRP